MELIRLPAELACRAGCHVTFIACCPRHLEDVVYPLMWEHLRTDHPEVWAEEMEHIQLEYKDLSMRKHAGEN